MTTLTIATRTLAEITGHPGAEAVAAATIPTDPPLDAVVLGRLSASTIEVIANGRVQGYADTTAVTVITDPERRADLLTAALAVIDQERRQLARQILADGTRHAGVLEEIRSYAIERYREAAFCLDGLNTFLRYFSLPEYEPSTRVSYTIHGSYRTERNDADAAESDAATCLGVDLSDVRDIVEGSADYHVVIDEVESLDC